MWIILLFFVFENWGVDKWLSHRILIPAYGGSSPPAPAKTYLPPTMIVNKHQLKTSFFRSRFCLFLLLFTIVCGNTPAVYGAQTETVSVIVEHGEGKN